VLQPFQRDTIESPKRAPQRSKSRPRRHLLIYPPDNTTTLQHYLPTTIPTSRRPCGETAVTIAERWGQAAATTGQGGPSASSCIRPVRVPGSTASVDYERDRL
jgi:hypothetical protein